LIRRQVAKLLLDRPELIEQGASVPLRPDHDGKDLQKSYRQRHAAGMSILGHRNDQRTCTHVWPTYQTVN
jgi:hypothetical protein